MKKLLSYMMLITLCVTFGNSKIAAQDDDAYVKDVFAKLLHAEDIQFYLVRADEILDGYYHTLTRTDEWMTYQVMIDDVFVVEHDIPFTDAPRNAQFFIVHPERYGYVIIHDDTVYVNHAKGSNITFEQAIDTGIVYDMETLDRYSENDTYDFVADKIHVISNAGNINDIEMDSDTVQQIATLIFDEDVDDEIEWTVAPVTINPELPESSLRSPYMLYVMTVDKTDTYFSLLPDDSVRVYKELPLNLDDPKFSNDAEFSFEETKRVLTEYDLYQLN